jgi:hypothetical protein
VPSFYHGDASLYWWSMFNDLDFGLTHVICVMTHDATNTINYPTHILSGIIIKFTNNGYKFSYNPYNIQCNLKDAFLADNECGELVILRILNEHLSNKDFADYCMKLGGFQIFQLVKYLDEDHDWVNVPKKN